ncbi:hypothetical protein H0H87_004081, partial [Tephrocybe sp. NHM501043]
QVILAWMASLGGHVQPSTIKAYLTSVYSLHTDANISSDAMDSPIMQHLIQEIKWYHGKCYCCPVQPITLSILLSIIEQLCPGITPGHTVLQAAFCLAYSRLLHSGEFTTGKGKYNPSLNLSHNNIEFVPNFNNITHAHLTLPASKTNPFHRGVTITIAAAPGWVTCPIAALKMMYIKLPHQPQAPLFK